MKALHGLSASLVLSSSLDVTCLMENVSPERKQLENT